MKDQQLLKSQVWTISFRASFTAVGCRGYNSRASHSYVESRLFQAAAVPTSRLRHSLMQVFEVEVFICPADAVLSRLHARLA